MIIKTPKWRRLTILIISFFIIIFLFEIYPRTQNLLIGTYKFIVKENANLSLDRVKSDFKIKNAEYIHLKSEISSLVTKYEENQKLSDLFLLLNKTAEKSNSKIVSVKPEKIVKTGNLWLQPINLTLEGNYEKIYNFVRFMETTDKVVILKDLTIKPVKLNRFMLEANIKMEIYLNL